MTSLIALVTGANQGIGYGIVRRLCKEHPDWIVYGTARSESNGHDAQLKLKGEGLTARFIKADLTDESSILAVKEHLIAEHGGLDVLVNNAGIAFKTAAVEPYAHKAEVTLGTNVFGTAMVCKHLLPILRDGARVVILSSFVALSALRAFQKCDPSKYAAFTKDPPLPLDTVLSYMRDFVQSVKDGNFAERGWPDDSAYSVSKMANTLMARAMQAEFDTAPERDLVVNACDPGFVGTNMSSYKGPLTIDQGADTAFYLATLPPHTDIRGKQVKERQVMPWL